MLKNTLTTTLNAYLLNPENIKEIENHINTNFVIIISELFEELELNKHIDKIVEKHVFYNLLNECWTVGNNLYGNGSTYRRKNIIEYGIKKEFNSDEFLGNPLYNEIFNILPDKNILKGIKYV